MIKHILKIVWNERKVNLLLVVESFLIFCILWFVGEYMFTQARRRIEPTGVDIKHTYRIFMQRTDAIDGKPTQYNKDDNFLFATTLYERLMRYPGIESVGFSRWASPYNSSDMDWHYTFPEVLDTVSDREAGSNNPKFFIFNLSEGMASRGYFDVFKIAVTGNLSDWDEPAESKKTILVPSPEGKLGGKPIADVRRILKLDRGSIYAAYDVKGYTAPIKLRDVDSYCEFRYDALWLRDVEFQREEISIRVSPKVDKNFVEKFTHDMSEQLNIGEFHLAGIVSYKDIRKSYYAITSLTEKMNMRLAIALFLFLNIFLGILGSFWFRTQARRNEIGLRMAMGSSKTKAKLMMTLEAMMLVVAASVAATAVCLFLQNTNLPHVVGAETMARTTYEYHTELPIGSQIVAKKVGIIAQDFINFGISFGLLALITFVAVWYPAKQAADTQPAETLHEE